MTLTHLVLVRIQAGQPFDAPPVGRLAHGLPAGQKSNVNALIDEARRMAPSLSRGIPIVYFLRLRSGQIYIGATLDLTQRLTDHASGSACRTTQIDPPVGVLRLERCATFAEARSREAQLKRWSRAKKLALIEGDFSLLRSLAQSAEKR